ncbi:CHAT domain-containing protein [Catenulispora sp. EB89]|uniref:CHAT domain-containing protein n=1 Tax=Catenulispora sp. EB89 TaxID=3156257 RepID=UPI00351207B2
MTDLERLRVLAEQGRHAELARAAEEVVVGEVAAGSAARGEVDLLCVRNRFEQGYVRDAHEMARRLLSDADPGCRLGLWSEFLALYAEPDADVMARLDEFDRLCAGAAASPDGPVAALAVDLSARAWTVRQVRGGKGTDSRVESMRRMAHAAEVYRSTGLVRDAADTLRRAAAIGAAGRAAERATALELLHRAGTLARTHGLRIAAAEVRLAVAALAFRDFLDDPSGYDFAPMVAEFEGAEADFAAAGHAFGEAKVASAVGLLLLAYGSEDGLAFAETAARGFAEADNPLGEQPVWAALSTWHTLRGDPDAARRASERAGILALASGVTLGIEVRALGEAHDALRAGEAGIAGPLLESSGRVAGSGDGAGAFPLASLVLAATTASSVGLKAEALERLETVVATLAETGATFALTEALSVAATLLTTEDPDRAAALLAQAADLAQDAETFAEQSRYLAQAAWGRVVARHAAGAVPLVDDAVLRDFDKAEAILSAQRTLAARSELVNLYEFRGQAAMFAADWDQCGHWLTRAEHVARTCGLLPQLAAILCHQGLTLITVARRAGPETYDIAADRLEKSLDLYRQTGLRPFVWQVTFHRALCDIEALRWPHPDGVSPSLEERVARASELLETVSEEIDYLRRSSEHGAAGRRQQVWSSFAADKQTFYEQAFQLAWDVRGDGAAAWLWLERAKGRALLDALGEPPRADATEDTEDTNDADAARTTPEARRLAAKRSAPAEFGEIRALLEAEEAATGRRIVLAQYLCTPRRTLMFLASPRHSRPHVVDVPLDHAALRSFAGVTFGVPGGVRMMAQDLADGGLAAWHRFAGLVEPLAAFARPDDVVYLAPHGALNDLPLHTLPIDDVPLIVRNPVCYIPAAAALRHTLTGGRGPERTAAVFGDPRGTLPSARQEAVDVARQLGVKPVLGPDVRREPVLAALASAAVVHIAGHGRVSAADGFDSFMELADRATLRAADLLPVRSAARLVVLSGCQTGVSEQLPGEEHAGFIRALLLSGVTTILASQWRVADDSTRELLTAFHRLRTGTPGTAGTARTAGAAGAAGLGPADALRGAVLDIRSRPGLDHLYHWGGFVPVGSWR